MAPPQSLGRIQWFVPCLVIATNSFNLLLPFPQVPWGWMLSNNFANQQPATRVLATVGNRE